MNSSTEQQPGMSAPMDDTQPLRKFMFERTFVGTLDTSILTQDEVKPTFSLDQMEITRNQAYESGFAAGQKSMEEDQRQKMNELLAQVTQKLDLALKISGEEWHRQLAHMQEMAIAITRKIIPDYVARHGLNEIQSIISQTVTEMAHEPRLVVRVSEAQFDAASARIKEITNKQAYEGKIVILGEPDLGPSDCRVEWADGGIERDLKTLWQAIEKIVQTKQKAPLNDSNPKPLSEPTPAPLHEAESASSISPTTNALGEQS